MLTPLTALSPLDGRYSAKVDSLRAFFSEAALIHFRLVVEVEWLKALSVLPELPAIRALTAAELEFLDELMAKDRAELAAKVKAIEATTNHDVKAVEYMLRAECEKTSLADVSGWIHFALTSEDVNNLAYALMLRGAIQEVLLPELQKLVEIIAASCRAWKDIPMLARTHGQPASPTTVGKVWLNFHARLTRQLGLLQNAEYLGKWNGATGNFNAHVVAFPEADWLQISREFVERFGLTWQPVSDQIEPHDFISEICQGFVRIDTILTQFARDIWGYIAWGYFGQKTKAGEVGSSTMPHKVNPIDFENAEGNFGLANALLSFFAEKLPVTRWQRDLTDSTVLRNLGVAFGHVLLALQSLQKGLGKLMLREEVLDRDLTENREVLAEAVQTVLRVHGVTDAYEQLKTLTRGKRLERSEYEAFVSALEIPETAKNALLQLTPRTYTGIAGRIVDEFL